MRRELTDLIGSGLLLAALVTATFAVLAPTSGAGTASSSVPAPSATAAATDPLYERGLALFYAKGCVGCHSHIAATSGASFGPDLTGLADRAGSRRPGLSAEAYVRGSLLTPTAYTVPGYREGAMPAFDLTEDELRALTAFLLAPDR